MGYEELIYRAYDPVQIILGKLGIQWQAQGFFGQALAVWKISRFSSQVFKNSLQVQGFGIMHAALNLTLLQIGVQSVTLGRANGVKMIDVLSIRSAKRDSYRELAE